MLQNCSLHADGQPLSSHMLHNCSLHTDGQPLSSHMLQNCSLHTAGQLNSKTSSSSLRRLTVNGCTHDVLENSSVKTELPEDGVGALAKQCNGTCEKWCTERWVWCRQTVTHRPVHRPQALHRSSKSSSITSDYVIK